MRRLPPFFALLAAVAFFPSPTRADEPISWANKFFTGKEQAPPPVVLHDFGTLPKGTIKNYRFNMKNIYAVPMQLDAPKPSCGCVSVLEYTGKMEPNERGHIDIQIDTSRFDNYKSISLPVYFEGRDAKNQKFWSYANVEIRAVSRADIAINPGAVQFGVVPAGENANQAITIQYSGRQHDWKITESKFREELFDVAVKPVAVRSGVAYELSASLKKNAPAGTFNEQIILKTNDPASPVLSLTASGTVQAPLGFVGGSDVIKFNGVEVGKKAEKKMLLQNANRGFQITKIEGDGEGVTSSFINFKDVKAQTVNVTFTPAKVGPVKQVLTITIDSGETVKLTVEGTGKDP